MSTISNSLIQRIVSHVSIRIVDISVNDTTGHEHPVLGSFFNSLKYEHLQMLISCHMTLTIDCSFSIIGLKCMKLLDFSLSFFTDCYHSQLRKLTDAVSGCNQSLWKPWGL